MQGPGFRSARYSTTSDQSLKGIKVVSASALLLELLLYNLGEET
jgi:hypothetical protein